jgi:hypothetical protein
VLGFAVIFFTNNRAAAEAATPAAVTFVVPEQARIGEAITIDIVANDARNVAGFQAAAQFDTAQLRVTSTDAGTGLSASGRQVLGMPPVTRTNGVVLGAATCPVADCFDPRLQAAARIPSGVHGHVVLGRLHLYTEAAGQYQLTLSDVQLVDPQGNQLPVTTTNATLTVAK